MAEQTEIRQLTWEDFKVAEEPIVEEVLESQGILPLKGIAKKEWNESVARKLLEQDFHRLELIQIATAFHITPAELNNNNNLFPKDIKRMHELIDMSAKWTDIYIAYSRAICTPSRDPLTGYMQE